MKRLSVLLLLAACAKPAAVVQNVPLRNPTTPVASQADATLARLQGSWRVVQSSRDAPGTPVVVMQDALRFGPVAAPLRRQGQGRFAWGDGALWVHWLDADNRTVAMGDPHGGWYAVLDRSGAPGERLRAAREILEWYGYDLSQVKEAE